MDNTYRIAPEVFAAHPGYARGLLVFEALDNQGTRPALIDGLRDAEARVREQAPDPIVSHPVVAAWREAYRAFGAKPAEHRSSIEAMVRRVIQPASLPTINPLVDIGNQVSLRYWLPAGVHPLPEAPVALALRPAAPDDRFLPPDGAAAETPPAREIVFAAGHEVLTRRWTWRQAAGTQTHPHSTRVFFNLDGLAPTSRAQVREAMDTACALVLAHCGGRLVHRAVLDAQAPATAWPHAS